MVNKLLHLFVDSQILSVGGPSLRYAQDKLGAKGRGWKPLLPVAFLTFALPSLIIPI